MARGPGLLTRRLVGLGCALAAGLALAPGASAAPPPSESTAAGTIAAIDGSGLTIQTGGREMSVIAAMIAAADHVSRQDLPYVYGGGHAQAGIASIGIKGPGYNGRRIGYDCSGSVAAVLAGGGVWKPDSGVPSDAGIIAQLRQERLIARGAGTGAQQVTLYDDWGTHIFMNIDGRFFGTSDGGSGNPQQNRGGAGWLDDGAPDANSRSYRRWHLLPAALGHRTVYGASVSFETGRDPGLIAAYTVGERVQVSYVERADGVNLAQTVGLLGAGAPGGTASGAPSGTASTPVAPQSAPQLTGQITAVAGDDSLFTVRFTDGESLTFSTGGNAAVLGSFTVGARVRVSYARSGGGLTAESVTSA